MRVRGRRIVLLLTALTIAASACGDGTSGGETSKKYHLGFLSASASGSFIDALKAGLKTHGYTEGVNLIFSAIENEHMFRATVRDPFDDPLVATRLAEAFQVLVDSVQRCMDEGRLGSGDAFRRALQIWMMGNGVLVACLGGFISIDDAVGHFYEMAWALLTTFGDDPAAARASLRRGRSRMERRSKTPSRRGRTARTASILKSPPTREPRITGRRHDRM